MLYPFTHNHNTEVTLGGVTLARVVEIVNGYVVTFEDGQYAVNIVGGNSNVGDRVTLNQVSIRSANSTGLQIVSVGSGLSAEQDTLLRAISPDLEVINLNVQDASRIIPASRPLP